MNAMTDSVSKSGMSSPRLAKIVFRFGLAVAVGLGGIVRATAASAFSLYKSTDQGSSWVPVGRGLPAESRINALEVAGLITVAGTDHGIFISRDGGLNWQPASQGVGTEARVLCLTTQAGRVFAGTHQQGVLASSDGGATWQDVNHGMTDRHVRSLLAAGTNLYAGTDREGVFVSMDAGASWTNQRAGLPKSSQVFDLAAVGEMVFAALYSQGLYRWSAQDGLLAKAGGAPASSTADSESSKDGRWLKAGEVAPLELVATGNTLVVGHNPGGVFVSEDLGKTWQDGNFGLPVNAPVWTLAAGEGQVLVGTTGKLGLGAEDVSLFASKNEGKSWSRSDTGLPASSAAVSFVVTKEFVLVGVVSPKTEDAPPVR